MSGGSIRDFGRPGNFGEAELLKHEMYLYLITGLLLYLAEPPLGLWPLGFVALIPVLHAATHSRTYRSAALGGFLAGATFFAPGLFWLTSTTIIGWAALALYCAVYVAVFAILARLTSNVLALAAGWTLLEFIRGAIAFTGFPWLLLSHSQYGFTPFVQILDIIGAYALSGLLVAMNGLLWKAITAGQRRNLAIAGSIVAGVCIYGFIRMYSVPLERAQHIAIVQASIPQEMKDALDEETYDPKGALTQYLKESSRISADKKIDLLVWPETVVLSPFTLNVNPDILNEGLA